VASFRSTRTRVIAVAVVVVAVFCALTLRLFVYPDLNAPVRSDAIIVLGATGTRALHEGLALGAEGYAPIVALSVPAYGPACWHPDVHRAAERVVCFRPNPATTQGEARWIGREAAVEHWHRIIVVMPTAQATRARMRIGRCYPGQVVEIGVPTDGFWAGLYKIAYEWAALGKALVLQRGC
jgi:hypothetical protein